MSEDEARLWETIKSSDFVTQQLHLLRQECEESGIPLEDIRHYWYKSKKFSIFAKNKVKGYEELRDLIVSDMQAHAPEYAKINRAPVSSPHLLAIDPSDVHIGKLAVMSEVGEDYNIREAIRRVNEGVEMIVRYSSGFQIDKVLLIIGNDALHIDHPHRTTTAGTPQDTDGMWHEAFLAAKRMYVGMIERLLGIADVHVIYNASNHDYMSGFFLADTISSWFHKCPNVTFDTSIRHRKYYRYGSNMIETDHGDGCKPKDTPLLMAHEMPQMWADCKHRYSYKHHIHHNVKMGSVFGIGGDEIGVNIEFLRSPSSPDGWHDRNGYRAMKSMQGFVHCPDQGRVASFMYNY